MERLSELRSLRPRRPARRGESAVEIHGTTPRAGRPAPRDPQVLTITHDDELTAYQLDDDDVAWESESKRPDGVVLGTLDGVSVVCFIELKTTLKADEDRAVKALAQVESALTHFHPSERAGRPRSHGDEHHDRFTSGDDELEVHPARDHRVLALGVTFRALPRLPPVRPLRMGDRDVLRAVIQVSPAKMNRAEVSFRRLLQLAGA